MSKVKLTKKTIKKLVKAGVKGPFVVVKETARLPKRLRKLMKFSPLKLW